MQILIAQANLGSDIVYKQILCETASNRTGKQQFVFCSILCLLSVLCLFGINSILH